MIEFGKTLREAREAAGLTIQQIAERTHMMSAMIEDLENERFNRIVAPIYGRGFVKLYCQTVGLDPKPLVEEFMDIYTGAKSPAIRERVITSKIEVEEPAPAPIEEASAPIEEPASASAPEPEPEPIEEPAPTPAPEPEFKLESDPPPKTPPQFTRYSAPLRDYTPDVNANIGMLDEMKLRLLRWAILGVGGILILWALCAGVSALYRATSKPVEEKPDIFSDKPLPRQSIVVPPLYID